MSLILSKEKTKLDCFLLRCGAIAIDYIILILPTVVGLVIARVFGADGARLFRSASYNLGLTLSFIVALLNLLFLPVFTQQSFGKMIVGLRIVKMDGKKVGYREILMRHFIGYSLSVLTLGIGFAVTIFNSQNRALHDLISNTKVICKDA